ncbi:MAG: PhoU domain-containing protein [Candidatus Zixiibacteriota bacterium]
MFEKFKELFASENLLDDAFKTTLTMLEFDREMYEASKMTLRESNTAELPFDIKQTDRKINKYEREVRRKVLTHLTVSGIHNLIPGLALVSIVIDVERIGDYTKNIYELATQHKQMLKAGKYEGTLLEIEKVIEDIFPKVIDVLQSQDKPTARSVMQVEESTALKCKLIEGAMIEGKDPDLSTASSVSLALYVRYLKRIDAHLTNIASSIVNPFARIGFREKLGPDEY